jgi:hypothetical protein
MRVYFPSHRDDGPESLKLEDVWLEVNSAPPGPIVEQRPRTSPPSRKRRVSRVRQQRRNTSAS